MKTRLAALAIAPVLFLSACVTTSTTTRSARWRRTRSSESTVPGGTSSPSIAHAGM